MRAYFSLWTLLAFVAIVLVILIGRAYDQATQQLRCLPDDPDACVITP